MTEKFCEMFTVRFSPPPLCSKDSIKLPERSGSCEDDDDEEEGEAADMEGNCLL